MISEISANGSVSGSDSRIVTGCSHDSNCAARIRYMKIERQQDRGEKRRRGAVQLARAAREVGRDIPAAMLSSRAASAIALLHRRLRRARQHVRDERDLPLPGDAADCRPAPSPRANRAMLSSVTMPEPRGRHRQRHDRRLGSAVPVLGAQCTSYCSPPSL